MVIRCAETAVKRRDANWTHPTIPPVGTLCAGCGARGYGDIRVDPAVKLPLCIDCRKGLKESVPS